MLFHILLSFPSLQQANADPMDIYQNSGKAFQATHWILKAKTGFSSLPKRLLPLVFFFWFEQASVICKRTSTKRVLSLHPKRKKRKKKRDALNVYTKASTSCKRDSPSLANSNLHKKDNIHDAIRLNF